MGEQEQSEQTLESLFEEVELILGKMQEREVTLEDSFSLYEEGIQKIKQCSEKIDGIEKKMLLLNEQGQLTPLDAE